MRAPFFSGLALASMLLLTFGGLAPVASSQAQGPRTLTVLVGAGQDTNQVLAFLPSRVRIRAGDTVQWRIVSDEIHSVSFHPSLQPRDDGFPQAGGVPRDLLAVTVPAPEGSPWPYMLNPLMFFPTRGPGDPVETYDGTSFVSSGVLAKRFDALGVPNSAYSLTFNTPGVYPYLCLIHVGGMPGTIEVVDATASDVPDQATMDAQARAEAASGMARLARDRERGEILRSEPGPNGTTLWYVRAGWGFGGIHLFEFLPKDLTVRVGDAVTWGSHYFHSVTFNPAPPPPEWLAPERQSDGSTLLLINPGIRDPIKPAGAFNPREYFNSGDLGPFSPYGLSSSLTFDTPGTFEYFCAIHRDLGMVGSITVVAGEG